jgi:hypothetical protein
MGIEQTKCLRDQVLLPSAASLTARKRTLRASCLTNAMCSIAIEREGISPAPDFVNLPPAKEAGA